VDQLQASGQLGEDFLIQLGSCTYEPKHTRFERYLSFGKLCERVQESSVVITHAGAGSTLTCIQQGKHPIMVPRRARDGEHVDEHQLPFTRKMCETGLATAIYEMSELPKIISDTRGRISSSDALGGSEELVGWLNSFWTAGCRKAGS
jgi:UDP-N-acetylglucosamine transferase subunit ALG13